MTEELAKEILKDTVTKDNSLTGSGNEWKKDNSFIFLKGNFSISELKAFIFWMETRGTQFKN